MNYSAYYSLVLLAISISFLLFGTASKVYKTSKVVFSFYVLVFSISVMYAMLQYDDTKAIEFYVAHFLSLLIISGFIIYKLRRKPKKYKILVSVMITSILFLIFMFFYAYNYFLTIHLIVIVFALCFSTWFVFRFKITTKLKDRR